MKTKTKRSKSEIIKGSAALLLKQLSSYWSDLPIGDLRSDLGRLVSEAESLSQSIEATFPKIDE